MHLLTLTDGQYEEIGRRLRAGEITAVEASAVVDLMLDEISAQLSVMALIDPDGHDERMRVVLASIGQLVDQLDRQ